MWPLVKFVVLLLGLRTGDTRLVDGFSCRCPLKSSPSLRPRGPRTSSLGSGTAVIRSLSGFGPSRILSPSSSSATALHSSLSLVGPRLAYLQHSLHRSESYCLTSIFLLSTFGVLLEKRTIVGKALSAPLATMALALVVANLGVMPFASPIYGMVNRYLVPLAVPMLLFDSDLRRVFRDTGSMLVAFGVGAFATVVATLVAYPLLPLKSLGSNGWKVASALAARHIGGAINFIAVAETLHIGGDAVSAAIAADNVVVAIYFAVLFTLAGPPIVDPNSENDVNGTASDKVVPADGEFEYELNSDAAESTGSGAVTASNIEDEITMSNLAIAASVASSLVTAGGLLTKAVLPAGTSSLPLTSVLTVAAATSFPKFFAGIRKAGTALGIICIQMFFASSGASGSIGLVLRQAPALFAFSALQIAIHFAVIIGLGRGLLRLPSRELYLSSNANIGGPTTAAAMVRNAEILEIELFTCLFVFFDSRH